ncbi:hypothetical protein [Allorhodopirellula solitaria]|uniref:Membrane-associated protein n=1 Tax=Allorhodopirellula solitaria TaxID=2527987 RepID=A0A5C5X1J6_9BACT|nr:hypothetical protein [Allorhodopirellula solitaria]TWT56092.1 hypothetical protein CA85_45650 [Allorhodopirellula solitaria]
MTSTTETRSKQRTALVAKIGFTAFMAVLVPYYWIEYGPTNFVYFCDIALFLTLAAVWTEKSIFASMALVGIAVPQLLWQVDFLGNFVGLPLTGMTDYMFDPNISLMGRGLSFFHFWLPILLLVIVYRLGYDRRAFWAWTLTAWAAMLIGYFLLPAPGDALDFANQPRNVNYVYGMSADAPQTWMPGWAWLTALMVGLPAFIYAPTHLLLARVMPCAHSGSGRGCQESYIPALSPDQNGDDPQSGTVGSETSHSPSFR